jgi:hypothetical protein
MSSCPGIHNKGRVLRPRFLFAAHHQFACAGAGSPMNAAQIIPGAVLAGHYIVMSSRSQTGSCCFPVAQVLCGKMGCTEINDSWHNKNGTR